MSAGSIPLRELRPLRPPRRSTTLTRVPTSWTVAMAILVACLLASIVIAAIKL